MSNILLPLRFSLLALTWLLLIHAGALLCLVPLALPFSLQLSVSVLIALSFYFAYARLKRVCLFDQLEWQAESQTWLLTDHARTREWELCLKPGCWLHEHFVLLSFSRKDQPSSGRISLWFAFDRYSRQELTYLRSTVLQHQRKSRAENPPMRAK